MAEYPLKLHVFDWSTSPRFFPWEHVQHAIDTMEAILYHHWIEMIHGEFLESSSPCPTCAREPNVLFWYTVSSPQAEWQAGKGRVGFLTVCPDCQQQINFHVDVELTAMQQEEFERSGATE